MTFSSFPSPLQVALQFASTRIRRIHLAVRTSEQSPGSVYGGFRPIITQRSVSSKERCIGATPPALKGSDARYIS